jgi:tRNA-2-methylthio-N6-dimethylallyladenosine synthase
VQSRTIDELLAEARWMVDGGARAVTLLGQTVNSWGEDLPPVGGERGGSGRRGRPGLADLLRALQELPGLERIRLITLHPAYVTPAFAAALADCDKVERFLPLPAQSGSDDVLRRMKRGYTVELYRRKVELLRAAVPDLELGTDWIVGFPGESERDFDGTLALLAEVGFAQSYVFKYDPRPDTAAQELPDDVAPAVKKERNQRLLRAAEEAAKDPGEDQHADDRGRQAEEPGPLPADPACQDQRAEGDQRCH